MSVQARSKNVAPRRGANGWQQDFTSAAMGNGRQSLRASTSSSNAASSARTLSRSGPRLSPATRQSSRARRTTTAGIESHSAERQPRRIAIERKRHWCVATGTSRRESLDQRQDQIANGTIERAVLIFNLMLDVRYMAQCVALQEDSVRWQCIVRRVMCQR